MHNKEQMIKAIINTFSSETIMIIKYCEQVGNESKSHLKQNIRKLCNKTIIDIYNVFDEINPYSSGIIHFEFLKDPENWSLITNFFRNKQNLPNLSQNIEISPDLLFEFFTDCFLAMDIKKSFLEKSNEYKKTNYVYNYLIEENKRSPFTHIFKEDLNYLIYEYKLNNKFIFRYVLSHDYESNKINYILKPDLIYGNVDPLDKTDTEKEIVSHYLKKFELNSGQIEITKEGIDNFISSFLDDINKFNITDYEIIQSAMLNQKMDASLYLLNKNYTEEVLRNDFKPYNTEFKDKNSRVFYHFNFCYPACLAFDIRSSFSNLIFLTPYFSKIKIEGLDINYNIIMDGFGLKLLRDDVELLEYKDIRISDTIKENIVKSIREDFIINYPFEQLEQKVETVLKPEIKSIFKNIDIKISYPDLPSLSMEEIISPERIPVTIEHSTGDLKLILKLEGSNKLNENEEIKAFKEKIKIKSSLKKSNKVKKEIRKRI